MYKVKDIKHCYEICMKETLSDAITADNAIRVCDALLANNITELNKSGHKQFISSISFAPIEEDIDNMTELVIYIMQDNGLDPEWEDVSIPESSLKCNVPYELYD